MSSRSPRSIAVLLANYIAERCAVRYSDYVLCLSERDSASLRRLYGRGATHILPMVLEDKCPPEFLVRSIPVEGSFALFVGGNFYANNAGIAWFVREVVPNIDVPIVIVGRGMDALRDQLEVPGKVTVVGAVDSLADWYRRSKFVIAPIFDGSGMKTKVAEALMYGKRVVGTNEAFSGYEDVVASAGWACNSAEDFVRAISEADSVITESFDPELRKVYEQRYSMDAGKQRMRLIFS